MSAVKRAVERQRELDALDEWEAARPQHGDKVGRLPLYLHNTVHVVVFNPDVAGDDGVASVFLGPDGWLENVRALHAMAPRARLYAFAHNTVWHWMPRS